MLSDSDMIGHKTLGSSESYRVANLKSRLTHALDRMISEMDKVAVQKLQAASDVDAIALLVLKSLDKSPLPSDRRFRMAIKGAQRFQEMVTKAGGTMDTTGAALLMKTTVDVIRKMVSRNKLLAFKQNGIWALPVAQFDSSMNKPVAHLGDLLDAFAPEASHDSRVIFCLTDYEGTGKNPLALLLDAFPVDILMNSAKTLYEHGAR
jgi:hypothetical protein